MTALSLGRRAVQPQPAEHRRPQHDRAPEDWQGEEAFTARQSRSAQKAFVASGTSILPVEAGSPCLLLATGFQAETLQVTTALGCAAQPEVTSGPAGWVGKADTAWTGDLGEGRKVFACSWG